MGELAQELIKTRPQNRSWTLQSYPGRVKLPSDIFRSLPNPEAAAKVCIPHFIISFFQIIDSHFGWSDPENCVSPSRNGRMAYRDCEASKACGYGCFQGVLHVDPALRPPFNYW